MNDIYKKIPLIMSSVGVVGKDKTNSMQGYKFRGIDDMYNALNPYLAKAGVFATSEVLTQSREERESKNGGVLIYSVITMRFKFFAEDGSFVESTTIGEAMDSGDKSMNKAMSVAYKYALMQIFCIPTEEAKDPEHDSPEPKPKQYSEQKQLQGTVTAKQLSFLQSLIVAKTGMLVDQYAGKWELKNDCVFEEMPAQKASELIEKFKLMPDKK